MNYIINYFFYLYLVLYICVVRFDMIDNIEKFLDFKCICSPLRREHGHPWNGTTPTSNTWTPMENGSMSEECAKLLR